MSGLVPPICPMCGVPTIWNTFAPAAADGVALSPWDLDESDRDYLRGLRIAPT